MEDKKPRLSKFFLRASFVYNPVIIQALGLCLVIAATTSLKVSLLLSVLISVTLIIAEALTAVFIKQLPNWVRVTAYMLIGLTVACPSMLLLERVNEELLTATGVYLPLISVNALVAVRCERYAAKHKVRESLFDGMASSLGFSAVMIITGAIREIIGSGTVWGKPLPWDAKMPGMLLPFGGLIMLGFMSAALKSVVAKLFPQNSKVIKNMDKPIVPERPPETNTMTVPPVRVRGPIEDGRNNVTEVGVHTVNIKDTIEKFVKNVSARHDGEDAGITEETAAPGSERSAEKKKRRDKNRAKKKKAGSQETLPGKHYTAPKAAEEEGKNISELLEEMDREYNVTASATSVEKTITPEEVREIEEGELEERPAPNPNIDLSMIRIGSDTPKSSEEYMETFAASSKAENGEEQPPEEPKPYNVDSQFEAIIKKYHLD